ncbi:MAG: xanthine dehydrogenase family protein subunit M [Alphaproteobacteria bacterium]|nr:xanthine dehydrogenase family protein subunit M [Alphaproteobacteria bacterium]MCB9930715.1 xanthine dehydrogenase family protein subunit M [Alphaproteobacteria bacterium]
MYEFTYHRATSLDDAKAKLGQGDDPTLMAGGMTLIPTLKQRLAMPSDVIDLGGIADLAGIRTDGDTLVIGAMTKHDTVANSAEVRAFCPALADLAGMIGDPMVRNRGTIGGSVANNDPAADYPSAVLGLGATVVTDRRAIAADDFFAGMFETALEPGEIIREFRFPKSKRAAYVKFPNPASRYAIVGVFVAETAGGTRVAVTGAASCVFRHGDMEAALAGNFAADAIADLQGDAAEMNSDIHASAEYRAHLVGVMARRAVASIA